VLAANAPQLLQQAHPSVLAGFLLAYGILGAGALAWPPAPARPGVVTRRQPCTAAAEPAFRAAPTQPHRHDHHRPTVVACLLGHTFDHDPVADTQQPLP
jgi:hypothetical protein